ncbi:DmsC/YnfH family molybdoenzyme membrane anchor subunit [Denitrobacterium detoxificans]|uniref:dimethyl sulfoxide reductase anchor subunit family protein n=1 Tax=Denitrobacterium detoxificans TaxID=79604 RepID=UPI0026EB4916|nr:DmsC/YnfH family molybdoenzyme membrane anchor subunit [Denitrobacterium detoxificans]MBE6465921.1 DUF4064 domain-containing protein [Denitrobacterium detoxificans]
MELQWPLILFTTFMAWSAGLFGAQGLYALRGEGAKAQMSALITSFVLLVVGGIAVFMHLQHWERIFNGFGHITSGITQELIAIVVMVVVMVLFFVYLRRAGEEGALPSWLAILAIVVAVALLIVCAHSYMMASRPAWNNIVQIVSILGAGCALGASTMALLAQLKGEAAEYSGKVNLIGHGLNAALTVIYVIVMGASTSAFFSVANWFDPTSPTRDVTSSASLSPFAGDVLPFTACAIIAALVGLVAAYMGKKQGEWKTWGAIGVVAAFVAALCLRVVFYQMGASVFPLY